MKWRLSRGVEVRGRASWLTVILAAGLTAQAALGATYVWNVAGSGDFQVAGNWTPARTAPATDDELVIDGSVTAGPVALTNLPDLQTIGKLRLINGANATFSTTGRPASRITLSGGTNALQIDAGCTLRLTGGGASPNFCVVVLEIPTGSTGTVSGDVIFNATVANVPHRISAFDAGSLVFTSGANAMMAPTTTGAGGGFGAQSGVPTPGPNSVIFQAGATYWQGGLKDGTRTGGTGSNPFALNLPNSIVVFQPGSTYVNLGGIPASSGRTYANFIWRDGYGAARDFGGSGTSTCTILNDFILEVPGGTLPSGSPVPSPLNFTLRAPLIIHGNFIIKTGGSKFSDNSTSLTSPTAISVRGNVDIQNPALFAPSTNANRIYLLNGTAPQSVNFAGLTLRNLSINNPAGVALSGSVSVSDLLDLVDGEVATGSHVLTVADGASAVSRANGHVTGTLTRSIDASVTGSRLFPVGTAGKYTPVSVDITIPGTGTGTLAVTSNDGDHPSVPNAGKALDRWWDLNAAGISGFTATVTFGYLASDVTAPANEAAFLGARYTGLGVIWDTFPFTLIDTLNHIATVGGVTAFSPWTLIEPAGDTTPPTLLAAVSRKTHGVAGAFNVNLPLSSSAAGIENRTGTSHTVVFTFDEDVAPGVGSSNIGTLTDGPLSNQKTVTITGTGPSACLTLVLSGITDLAGNPLAGDNDVNLGVLTGDVTGDRSVNIFDLVNVRNNLTTAVVPANFRADVAPDGNINIFDLVNTRNNLGNTLTCP